ncbi:anhydro-N-acetylmuramic acid kinase [Parablautia muri]|uniref:Anhydro-N-acetylmuramic acid kinase n=1 Tax=Parablautia muri TaxID=2320879 RepID=A0A9X5BDK8_9FIRM|nr:anhydro-N-acetylmuramic acid kinase [Parablautia muri]NBJ91567.1 anhydro-N-acetylmuramic acid kinase [Parablautia muri]
MHPLAKLAGKESRLVIGLMSGTSADGIDAALVKIEGYWLATKVEQLGFITVPYPEKARNEILKAASGDYGGSHTICNLNFFLGKLFAESCKDLCKECGISPGDIDIVGSHGQTLWHIPGKEMFLGKCFSSTLQIGEAAVIAEEMNCPVVSDFRVRDMAAGGLGAPLVPYTEYLLYRRKERTIALQNIGGIGNITILPADCSLEEVYAFDTGPGNMVMDALTECLTEGKLTFDQGGRMAASGKVDRKLLSFMMEDSYLKAPIPKTTGRERYGKDYVKRLIKEAEEMGVSLLDTLTTATCFTAECIRIGIENFCRPLPEQLIVGGGGSQNKLLMTFIKKALPKCQVIINEDIHLDSNAKEAIAFAVLANETVCCHFNNAVKATGAEHPVVMGKISF